MPFDAYAPTFETPGLYGKSKVRISGVTFWWKRCVIQRNRFPTVSNAFEINGLHEIKQGTLPEVSESVYKHTYPFEKNAIQETSSLGGGVDNTCQR
jgi:hypothetical protein